MPKLQKVSFSLATISAGNLIVLPFAEPTADTFRKSLERELSAVWPEASGEHLSLVDLLRSENQAGRVLWGYSEFRVSDRGKRLTWRKWDNFSQKHFGVATQSPSRPSILNLQNFLKEVCFLVGKKVFLLEGTLLLPMSPESDEKKSGNPKKSKRKPADDENDDEERTRSVSPSSDRWDYFEQHMAG